MRHDPRHPDFYQDDEAQKPAIEPQHIGAKTLAAVGLTVSLVGGTAYGVDRIKDYADEHPPTTSYEEIKEGLLNKPPQTESPQSSGQMEIAQTPTEVTATHVVPTNVQ